MSVKLLCAADLHLGRRPSGLSAALSDGLSNATAWEHLVEHAIAEAVEVVLLAGDIVDEFNRSFEAWGPLERGIRRLAEADIPVVAVSGNHDFDTLPDISREVGGGNLSVLGVGGRWERWTLYNDAGEARLHVDGWSFPRRHYDADPTADYELQRNDDVPVVGLLHCDLDQANSRYAPVRASALQRHPVAAWILGHIHKPELRDAPGGAPILYPGSLQALDPGEAGAHGAWIVTVGPDRVPSFQSIPLSGVRYDTVDVDVADVEDSAELNRRIRMALTEHLSTLADADEGRLRVAHCRVRLTGRTNLHGTIEKLTEGLDDFDPHGRGGIKLSIEPRLILDTRPALDLEDLAGGSDAPAKLAQLLLSLDGRDELPPELLRKASSASQAVLGQSHYMEAGLTHVKMESESPLLRDALRRQATRLLGALVTSEGGR